MDDSALTRLGNFMRVLPGVAPVADSIALSTVQRLLGFWLMWHIAGGMQAGLDAGFWSKASAYRLRDEFQSVFGTDVDEFLPELSAVVRLAAAPR